MFEFVELPNSPVCVHFRECVRVCSYYIYSTLLTTSIYFVQMF